MGCSIEWNAKNHTPTQSPSSRALELASRGWLTTSVISSSLSHSTFVRCRRCEVFCPLLLDMLHSNYIAIGFLAVLQSFCMRVHVKKSSYQQVPVHVRSQYTLPQHSLKR